VGPGTLWKACSRLRAGRLFQPLWRNPLRWPGVYPFGEGLRRIIESLSSPATEMPAAHNSDILAIMIRKSPFRTFLLAWLLAGLAGVDIPAARGQENPTVVSIVPSLDWQLESSAAVDPSVLAHWGGDATIEREYGVTALTARTYSFEGHTADVLVEQASDPSAAYGLWTFYRAPEMTPVRGMLLTVASPQKALLVRGAAFIRIRISLRGQETLAGAEERSLLRTVGGPLPSARAFEQLPAGLPPHDLIRGSEKYILGPLAAARELPSLPTALFGFNEGAEVQTADYSAGTGHPLTLAAINYPTPQIASAAFDSISKNLSQRGESKISARRQDTYVFMVVNAPSRAVAERFLDQFKVTKVINQDEGNPDEGTDVVALLRLLIANGMLIIEIVVLSLAGGLLVFVSKRLARKWFANSVWVQGEEGGMILLNLR
jgi:hypothetical protein